jgi:hypothetical protein
MIINHHTMHAWCVSEWVSLPYLLCVQVQTCSDRCKNKRKRHRQQQNRLAKAGPADPAEGETAGDTAGSPSS